MFLPPFISNKTKCVSFNCGYVCCTGDEAFKRRLVLSGALIIMA